MYIYIHIYIYIYICMKYTLVSKAFCAINIRLIVTCMSFIVTLCSGRSNVKRKSLCALQLQVLNLACGPISIDINGTHSTFSSDKNLVTVWCISQEMFACFTIYRYMFRRCQIIERSGVYNWNYPPTWVRDPGLGHNIQWPIKSVALPGFLEILFAAFKLGTGLVWFFRLK